MPNYYHSLKKKLAISNSRLLLCFLVEKYTFTKKKDKKTITVVLNRIFNNRFLDFFTS